VVGTITEKWAGTNTIVIPGRWAGTNAFFTWNVGWNKRLIYLESGLEQTLFYLECGLDILAESGLLPVVHDENSSVDLPHAQVAPSNFSKKTFKIKSKTTLTLGITHQMPCLPCVPGTRRSILSLAV
jgi:hypothetical protein